MSRDVEQRARDMGWVPKEDFNGPDENWKSAEDFVRIGENYMPVLRERLGKLESLITDLRTENERTKGSLQSLANHHRGTWKRQYERAKTDIEAEMAAAVERGDGEAFQQLKQAERELEDAAQAENPDNQPTPVPEFIEFKAINPWYGTDPEMSMYADGLQSVLTQHEGITDDKTFFQEVEKRVRLRFPDKFKNQNQELPPAVESGDGGSGVGGESQEKKWGDIPSEERASILREFGPELFTNEYTKEDYAKEYWLMNQ